MKYMWTAKIEIRLRLAYCLMIKKVRYLISSILNNEYVTAKKRISLIFSSSLSIRVIPFARVFDFLRSWLKNHIRSYFINDYILQVWIYFSTKFVETSVV